MKNEEKEKLIEPKIADRFEEVFFFIRKYIPIREMIVCNMTINAIAVVWFRKKYNKFEGEKIIV